tara:strand:- start:2032 stop:3639 length:1608 start_codon:yes stop_codon:yes gene_type:complete
MAFKRYVASADTTIVNTYQPDLKIRGTGANAGMADVLEVYSVYGRQASSSQELSRVLIKFPVSSISSDRTAGSIPASGSVSFYLRMYNAQHSKTVPKSFTFSIFPVAQSWQEGDGLDLETYKDLTKGNPGANWMSASGETAWTGSTLSTTQYSVGGAYRTGSTTPSFKADFTSGLEDIEVDITPLVEHWIAETVPNYGVGVHLSSSYEASSSVAANLEDPAVLPITGGVTTSYFTKRLFARGSQYFFKRPTIEARWNSARKDNRGDFYYSSSLAPASANMNTIYFYNYIRGALKNIPDLGGDNRVYVSIFSGNAGNTAPSASALLLAADNSGFVRSAASTVVTGGLVSTGIYSASFAITAASTPVTTLYDVWFTGSHAHVATTATTQYLTGTITPQVITPAQTVSKPVYYLNITNLKGRYRGDETARFNLYVRNKFWSPTVYTVANATPDSTTIQSASYRVFRIMDAYEAIPYATGSDLYTMLSYDVSGNYFDFDMNNLEPGYEYAFKFSFYDPALSSWTEQPEVFKFRVEKYEY